MQRVPVLICFLFLGATAFAQWSNNPNINNAISTAAFDQGPPPAIVSDGSGGAIITWEDFRSGTTNDIYAQRINSGGVVQWAGDGVTISTAAFDQINPVIVSDGSGGAIITWADFRSGTNGDIYAQRINSSGVVQWAADGVIISTASNSLQAPTVVSDDSGGAIITWADVRIGPAYDIYAQRINSSGVVQWTTDGVAISTASANQRTPTITSDGSGGAIITWTDFRSGTTNDIYAQRINSSGVVQWAADGVAISTAANDQSGPIIVSDGLGGAIITWSDRRSSNGDIYAQRINSSGAVEWTPNGVAISTGLIEQYLPTIASDGSGGAIISWTTGGDIYAQRINSSGAGQWTANGIAISTNTFSQSYSVIVSDGSGGAIIAWEDDRNGTIDIYAQRIDSNGVALWMADGVAISTLGGSQRFAQVASDGVRGGIITWHDSRSGSSADIYAQKVDEYGYLGNVAANLTDVADIINDQGGRVNVFWNRSYGDVTGSGAFVSMYQLYRGASGPAPAANATVLTRSEYQAKLAKGESVKGFLWTENPAIASPSTIYWEYYGEVIPRQRPNYYFTMNTLADSAIQGIYQTYAMVTTVGYDPFSGLLYWDSNPDSGYSVDNLPPGSIPNVAPPVVLPGSVTLSWSSPSDPDLNGFAIYRGDESGFVADGSSHIATTPDTFFVDTDPGPLSVSSFRRYYRVAAVDIHGNQGQLTPEIAATQASSYAFGVNASWNLVSVPIEVDDYAKTALFPTATSDAFAYSGFYTAHPTLQNGVGYWLKFPASQTITLLGYETDVDTIDVAEGWNIVGSLAVPVTVTSIASVPPGIVTEQFYGFGAFGYYVAGTIEPGKGYWVKVNQSGKLVLSSLTPDAADRIQIVPTTELPPPPPDGAITGLQSQIPTEFALEQNYPNPFNPSTSIRFSIPVSGLTTLKLFDALGREVATLVNQHLEAGQYARTLYAGNLGSGVYFYRLTAGTSVETRKMILAK